MITKVNVYDPENGKRYVELYLKMEQGPDGARFGLAIDGSTSMRRNFGIPFPIPLPNLNIMQEIVRKVHNFLRPMSARNEVDMIYWATGKGGSEIEVVGAVEDENMLEVEGPQIWGPGTKLGPVLECYGNLYKDIADTPWSMLVIVTDGKIEDMEEVKQKSLEIGREYAKGTRGYTKFVLLGVGKDVDESQMEELNDMFEGEGIFVPGTHDEIDLWDSRHVATMNSLWDIFGEVDFGFKIPGQAVISDEKGNEIISYPDEVPVKMDFFVPEKTKSIKINMFGKEIIQSVETN